MSSNQYLSDVYSRRQVYLDRYNRQHALNLKSYVNDALKASLDWYKDQDISDWQKSRLEGRISGLKAVLEEIYKTFSDDFIADTGELIQSEFEFTAVALEKAIAGNYTAAIPNWEIIYQIATEQPLRLKSKLHNIPDAIAKYTADQQRKIITSIQAAAEEGLTLDQVKSRLTSVGVESTREAETLARTINNHVTTTARNEVLRANDDVLEGWRLVATLDSRTTPICAAKDNQVYGWDDRQPPYHYNCRSTISPVVKQEYSRNITGTRAARGESGKTEQVNANLSYETWLRRQPAEFQRDVLGPGKYELFTKHKLSLEKFVDYNDAPLSIQQIKLRNNIALSE